jgi:hypothetical protein
LITIDNYLTGVAKLINDSSVTSLLNGGITKGAKRPDNVNYPCLTVLGTETSVGQNSELQTFDGLINIFVASERNGTAPTSTLSSIESALITLVNVASWNNGTTRCISQYFTGTTQPFWDANDANVHFCALQMRSFMVDAS